MFLARPTAVHAAPRSSKPIESASAFSKVTRSGQPSPAITNCGPPRPQRHADDQSGQGPGRSEPYFLQNGEGCAPAAALPSSAFVLEPPAVPAAVPVRSAVQTGCLFDAEGGGRCGGLGGFGLGSTRTAQMEEELGRLYGMHLNSLMQIQAQLQRVRSQARSPTTAVARR